MREPMYDNGQSSGVPPPSNGDPSSQYQIQRGDSLYKIAQSRLPPGSSHKDIMNAINNMAHENGIVDPDRIKAGAMLQMPAGLNPQAAPAPGAAPPGMPMPGQGAAPLDASLAGTGSTPMDNGMSAPPPGMDIAGGATPDGMTMPAPSIGGGDPNADKMDNLDQILGRQNPSNQQSLAQSVPSQPINVHVHNYPAQPPPAPSPIAAPNPYENPYSPTNLANNILGPSPGPVPDRLQAGSSPFFGGDMSPSAPKTAPPQGAPSPYQMGSMLPSNLASNILGPPGAPGAPPPSSGPFFPGDKPTNPSLSKKKKKK